MFGLLRPATPEFTRYLLTLRKCHALAEAAPDTHQLRACDLGGYFGIISALLADLGWEAHVVDSYGPLMNGRDHLDLQRWWEARGLVVHDVDLQQPALILPFANARFDLVTLLAVIEHFPNTPRLVLTEARRILEPDGVLIVDVPNAGALGTRVGFLLHGEALWARVDDLYFSDVPFAGHKRCYSPNELVQVLEWAGFTPTDVVLFDLADEPGHSGSIPPESS